MSANWIPRKEDVVYNHVESFNMFLKDGLKTIVENLKPVDIEHSRNEGDIMTVSIKDLVINKPQKMGKGIGEPAPTKWQMYPSECREAMYNYNGMLSARVVTNSREYNVQLGAIPIMVSSAACHLHGLSPQQLVECKEEAEELGGTFIIGGNERVIRLLAMGRANYPIAIERPSFGNRGPLYTGYATQMRCMRSDWTTQTLTLHYRRDGICFVRIAYYKTEYLIPMVVIAKCLSTVDPSDKRLFERFVDGIWDDTYTAERVKNMLETQVQSDPLPTQRHALCYIGKQFRTVMGVRSTMSDEEAGREFINDTIFVHCKNFEDKLGVLIVMFQKLLGLVRGTVKVDNPDAFAMQEVLLPGQLYGAMLKDILQENLRRLKQRVQFEAIRGGTSVEGAIEGPNFDKFVKECLDVSRDMKYFLATGNVRSKTGLDLQQASGFTIVADKLNAFRYASHFRAIHRGQYFMEMKTTAVRKLLPETWGFLCPVHTPDGGPCGLLNHLAAQCFSVIRPIEEQTKANVMEVLTKLNVDVCSGQNVPLLPGDEYLWVTLDGIPVGKVKKEFLEDVADKLRKIKCKQDYGIRNDLEIMCVLPGQQLFSGLFLYSGPCRVVRPIKHLKTQLREYVGPLEQMFMNIAVSSNDVETMHSGLKQNCNLKSMGDRECFPLNYTHIELHPAAMLSYLAALTPFTNHNQSPRSMYQCQMLKQTMGTPYLNNPHRTDNKSYKVYTPQKPLVRTRMYDQMDGNTHPSGTNAIVAVIAHTGYDMEDAMIINKGSMERGFKHGVVYKTKIVNAGGDSMMAKDWQFSRSCLKPNEHPHIDTDGLPKIGTKLENGMLLCTMVKTGVEMESKKEKYKDEEPAYVDQVNLIRGGWYGEQKLGNNAMRAVIKLRIVRNPNIGDKFASRHGQKGVMSMLWPSENMPFTGSGCVPDIMFNPHGFPSRMTVGMLIESIAGKAAAVNGYTDADATAFRQYVGEYKGGNNEGDPFMQDTSKEKHYDQLKRDIPHKDGESPADYFGTALESQGFECLGTDEMYCGMYGEPMTVRIFMGVIYYQRLRHMVNDKAQVRATGPIDPMTRQPVKGRKRHGGIRFGEMERDSLLAHGTTFLLHDRLCKSSDFCVTSLCPQCGSIVSPVRENNKDDMQVRSFPKKQLRSDKDVRDLCHRCQVPCKTVPMPYVFRYLAMELAAMNISIELTTSDIGQVKFTKTNAEVDN